MFNTVQEVLIGALKGGHDISSAMKIHSIGTLIIGLPLQIVLFVTMFSKLEGIWFGLAVGMLFVCFTFIWRLSRHDYEMASFNLIKAKEEQEKKKQTTSSFDKMLNYKAPPNKISPKKQGNAIN